MHLHSELHHSGIFILIDDRELALQYKNRRRKIDPALYNGNRLKERPFPSMNRNAQPSTKGVTQPNQNKPQPKRTQRKIVTCVVCPNTTLVTPPISPTNAVDENETNTEADIENDVSLTFCSIDFQ